MIPMPASSDRCSWVLGDQPLLEQAFTAPALPPFAPEILAFLEQLGHNLQQLAGREHADIATLAFWLRRAHLQAMRARYDDVDRRLGLGFVMHSTPSNVPLNFAYSLAAGLLAGNANAVRMPRRVFPQEAIVVQALRETLVAMPHLAPYIVLVRYASDTGMTEYLSAQCMARLVWGGDETVKRFRAVPLPPRARDIAFADRYSIALLDADAVLHCEDMTRLAQDFHNDTYLVDQNACSSPTLVVWLGQPDAVAQAQRVFWDAVAVRAANYPLAAVQAVDKLRRVCTLATRHDISCPRGEDNTLVRVQLMTLDETTMEHRGNSGFFLEYAALDLDELAPVLANKCQTVSCFGVDRREVLDFVRAKGLRGVDRIVPIGHALDFDIVWDGHDLIRELSRIICRQ